MMARHSHSKNSNRISRVAAVPTFKPRLKQRGSSMLEVLIGLTILAVGLMPIQVMQLSSLRANTDAALATTAQLLASDMVERILAFDDITSSLDDTLYSGLDSDGTATDPNCASSGCGSSQQKSHDLYQWKLQLESNLPAGRGRVSLNGDNYVVTVFWDADRSGATGIDCGIDKTVDLSCYQIQVNI